MEGHGRSWKGRGGDLGRCRTCEKREPSCLLIQPLISSAFGGGAEMSAGGPPAGVGPPPAMERRARCACRWAVVDMREVRDARDERAAASAAHRCAVSAVEIEWTADRRFCRFICDASTTWAGRGDRRGAKLSEGFGRRCVGDLGDSAPGR